MRLVRLHLDRFRLFERVEIPLEPGLNLFTGANGAGKTSILEAVHLLAYGRSFRGGVKDGLIQRGQSTLQVYAELESHAGESVRLGIERGIRDWRARVDGETVSLLSDLYREVAAVSFEPGSHELIGGSSEQRRRFLDWGLFHVEPHFMPNWRRYQRALKQRNALLKLQSAEDSMLSAWERELSEAAVLLDRQRRTYLDKLRPALLEQAHHVAPGLGALTLSYRKGWTGEPGDLATVLVAQRGRDMAMGYTSSGPHRADWMVNFERVPERNMLSRGQEKVAAFVCILGQASMHATALGSWPIICLDDLASELDQTHLGNALRLLRTSPAQILLTGLEAPPVLDAWAGTAATFHVEQGKIARLL